MLLLLNVQLRLFGLKCLLRVLLNSIACILATSKTLLFPGILMLSLPFLPSKVAVIYRKSCKKQIDYPAMDLSCTSDIQNQPRKPDTLCLQPLLFLHGRCTTRSPRNSLGNRPNRHQLSYTRPTQYSANTLISVLYFHLFKLGRTPYRERWRWVPL